MFIPTWSILPSRLLSDYFCHKIAAADEFDDAFDEEFEAAEEPTGILGKIDDSDEELGDAFDSDDDDGGEEDDNNDDDTEGGAAGGVEKKLRIATWVRWKHLIQLTPLSYKHSTSR